MSNKDAGQTNRDEHNDNALAKRVLPVGFDYENEEYRVIAVNSKSETKVSDSSNITVEERLGAIEDAMKILLLHAQAVTGEEFTIEDIESERD